RYLTEQEQRKADAAQKQNKKSNENESQLEINVWKVREPKKLKNSVSIDDNKMLLHSPNEDLKKLLKVVLAEPNIPPFLDHLFTSQDEFMLDKVNPYANRFYSISNHTPDFSVNLSMQIHTNILELDQRTHNTPTASQVAAVWVEEDISSGAIQKRDIILCTKIDKLVRISEFSGCYDPLAYPLLLPYGEQGVSLTPEATTETTNANDTPLADITNIIEYFNNDLIDNSNENPDDDNEVTVTDEIAL
ncbi:7690_t:CDS:2, partial [Racocetra fulgida]